MRFGTDKKFWIVADPGPSDEMGDMCFAVSLRELELQFRGGFTCERDPALFTDQEEAEAEARARLLARNAALALAEGAAGIEGADRVQILDAEGKVLVTASLRRAR